MCGTKVYTNNHSIYMKIQKLYQGNGHIWLFILPDTAIKFGKKLTDNQKMPVYHVIIINEVIENETNISKLSLK